MTEISCECMNTAMIGFGLFLIIIGILLKYYQLFMKGRNGKIDD